MRFVRECVFGINNNYKRMFSKLAAQQQLTALTTRAFRASAVTSASKKPSIGDAVTILQSKVSQINQVVSSTCKHSWYARALLLRKCPFPI